MKAINPFKSIPVRKPGSNLFDLSCERKGSYNMGGLYPIHLQEIVPGDNFKVNTEVMLRFMPMQYAPFHRVNVFVHWWYVPMRQVYDEFEDWITGGEDGLQEPAFPKMTVQTESYFRAGTLADHLGLPTIPGTDTITETTEISAIPFRVYQHIYNTKYRDQNLIDEIEFSTSGTLDSGDGLRLTTLRDRAWNQDYLTSCLPNAQKGGAVLLPVSSSFSPDYLDEAYFESLTAPSGDESLVANSDEKIENTVSGETGIIRNLADPQVVDTTSITVNDLRVALKLQQWMEKNARAGGRYIESLLVHWGIISDDLRIQQPKFMGGGRQPVVISEVLQTGQTDTTPQGTIAGHGISIGSNMGMKGKFKEHGYLMAIMSILPIANYQNRMPRMFQRFDKYDVFWNQFAHLGEQAVKYIEAYYDYDGSGTYDNDETFGYQSRYADYKFNDSTVHGELKESLSMMHFGRIFAQQQELNEDFITCKRNVATVHRPFAVTDTSEDKIYGQIYHNIRAIRPMPIFGEPTL